MPGKARHAALAPSDRPMETALPITRPLGARVASILAMLFGVALLAACSSSSARTADNASTNPADQAPLPSTERSHAAPTATSSEPTRPDSAKELSAAARSQWTFEVTPDKVTDTPTLSASIKADSGDGKNDYGYPSHLLYELSFKCGAGVNQITLFTSTTPTTDECSSHGRDCTTARLIPWVAEPGNFVAPFRYRLDNANGDAASLVLVLGVRRNTFDQRASGDASAIFRGTRALPQSRLVVADVFPGETVEFSFSTLTQQQRTAIETMCFQ